MCQSGISMKSVLRVVVLLVPIAGGCSIKQQITRLEDPKPKSVCIVEHAAVRNGVLIALQDGFRNHGIDTQVVPGTYERTGSLWQPKWESEKVTACDALCFYVANWNWDMAMYMYFANIWMTTPDGNRKLAQATYDASLGGARPDKFIKGRDKILELVDQMTAGTREQKISVVP